MNKRLRLPYRAELGLMLAPYLLGVIGLIGLPALISVGMAFVFYDALSPPQWAGLANFREILTDPADPLFKIALANSLYFVALAVPLRTLGALALALWLNRQRRGVGLYRVAVYLPTIVPDVAYALIWLWIFNPLYGPVNLTLNALHLPAPGWLADADTAKLVFVIMAFFQIGEGFVVLLAGLQNIPPEYYAAAAVDGATGWQTLRHVTLPLLAPWLLLLTVRDIILSFQTTFTANYIMTGGGPYYATLFLPMQIYSEAFDAFRFGPGAAMMLLMFALTVALIGILLSFLSDWREADEH
jgi:multiple sugar transport system permease protein